jgi:glucosamine--fructose-6-phosphate aminotransferase (isomerizing)
MAADARGEPVTDPAADRVDAFLADILAGPDELVAVLAAQRAATRDLPYGVTARPVWRFAGMGSSRFAAMDAATRLRSVGRDAHAELASAAGGSPGGRDVLFTAISASGRTAETLAAVEHHLGSSFVLGLSARGDSPLVRLSDAGIPLTGGRAETAAIACLSYRATVAALALLAAEGEPELESGGIDDAAPALAALIAGRDAWLAAAADRLDEGRPVHVLGNGARIGGLEQAALMLREGPRIAALPFDTGDWLHAGLYTLFPGDPVLLFTGSPADDEAVATIRARGGVLVSVGVDRPDADASVPLPAAVLADPVVRALVEPAVAELLAAELWRRTGARTIGESRTS